MLRYGPTLWWQNLTYLSTFIMGQIWTFRHQLFTHPNVWAYTAQATQTLYILLHWCLHSQEHIGLKMNLSQAHKQKQTQTKTSPQLLCLSILPSSPTIWPSLHHATWYKLHFQSPPVFPSIVKMSSRSCMRREDRCHNIRAALQGLSCNSKLKVLCASHYKPKPTVRPSRLRSPWVNCLSKSSWSSLCFSSVNTAAPTGGGGTSASLMSPFTPCKGQIGHSDSEDMSALKWWQ